MKDTDTLIVTATFNEALGGIPTIAIDTTGTDLTATPMTGSGTVWTYTYDVPSGSDGAATIAISVNDVAGNANSAATNATFTIDNTLPTFTINSGTDAGPVKTDVINISVGDTNNIPVKEYGYSADNICNGTDTYGNAFTSAVNFSITGDRTNYLCVKASDAAGNTAYQLVGQLNTDNTLPIVSSILSNTDPAKSGDTLTITFNVNEALAAHPTVTVAGNAATYSADNGTTYTYTYLVAGTEGTGEKTITVSATDVAGNVGTGSITNQTFDFTPPAITSLSTSKDPAKSGDVLSITFNASEPLSGNPTVTVAGNAATYSNLSGLTYTYTYTIAGTETEGDVTIAVNATDVVGNTGSASLTTQTLDYTQPGVTLTYSLNRAVRDADTMIITATFTEPVSASPTIAINTTGTNLSAVAMVASSGTVWTYS
ncbi:MAG: Ig-like domain-containing protein, partial [Candidatus Falkowbacteria bacterium]|nr:Ig-like domain-containing protein [Candidatus Falkowbacteria bacterium]